jgi:hypothetical protein
MLMLNDIKDFLVWAKNRPASEVEDPSRFSKKLCLLGRHDYEFVKTLPDGAALLRCFYCEHEKISNPLNNILGVRRNPVRRAR